MIKPKIKIKLKVRLPSEGEALFNLHCKAHGLQPVAEYVFAAPRRWRFDFCFVDERLAVEIEGGAWSGGRHTRGAGFVGDMGKYNAAVILGYRVLRFTPEMVKSGVAIETVNSMMNRIKNG